MGNTIKYQHSENTDEWVQNEDAFNDFQDGIISIADRVKQKYKLDDATFNRLQKLALSLGMQETSFGDKRLHNANKARDSWPVIGGTEFFSDVTHGLEGKDQSRGYSNIKYYEQNNGTERVQHEDKTITRNLDKDVLSSFGLSPGDLWVPRKSGMATIIALAALYNRHRVAIESGDYRSAPTTRRRPKGDQAEKRGLVLIDRKTGQPKQFPNIEAGMPLQMEDVLSTMWNGYIEGKTKVAGPNLNRREGSSYAYKNKLLRTKYLSVDPNNMERTVFLPEITVIGKAPIAPPDWGEILSNSFIDSKMKHIGIYKNGQKFPNGDIKGNELTLGNQHFNITSNSDVRDLQQLLNQNYNANLVTDGLYGKNTINATANALKAASNRNGALYQPNYRQSGRKGRGGYRTYIDSNGYEFAFSKKPGIRLYDNNGDRMFTAAETKPSNNAVRYMAQTIIPELQSLNGYQIDKLRKSYGLPGGTIIDNNLINALTKDGYKKFSGFNLNNPATQTDCTRYVLNQIYARIDPNPAQGYRNGRLKAYRGNIGGNAWDIGQNIVKGGGKKLFDIYTDVNGNKSNPQQFVQKNWDKGWRPKVKELQIGDIVGLYYAPSPHHRELASGTGIGQGYRGTDLNTHSGIVVGYSEKGNPIVSHNVHGQVYNEEMIQGTTYGGQPHNWGNRPTGFIVSAYRPNYRKTGYRY